MNITYNGTPPITEASPILPPPSLFPSQTTTEYFSRLRDRNHFLSSSLSESYSPNVNNSFSSSSAPWYYFQLLQRSSRPFANKLRRYSLVLMTAPDPSSCCQPIVPEQKKLQPALTQRGLMSTICPISRPTEPAKSRYEFRSTVGARHEFRFHRFRYENRQIPTPEGSAADP